MSSLETKEKLSLLSLPNELLFSCIAHISRLYYPTLSLVSRRFRSLIASPELYKVRSLLGRTESCLYVCRRYYESIYEGMHRWFTLCRNPDHQTLTNDINKPSGYVLAAIPVPLCHPQKGFVSFVSDGYNIYNIIKCSRISILDCRSHTWCEGPSMGKDMLTLYDAVAVDQKIYVSGNCKDDDSDSSKKSVQVFDTKTGNFDPIPCREIQGEFDLWCERIDRKFHVRNGHMVAYDSKEGRWDPVEVVGKYVYIASYFEIENVIYYFYDGVLMWYDSTEDMWREVKGLVGLPQLSIYSLVKLVDYGGKMALFWEENRIVGVVKDMMIWCVEITLEIWEGGGEIEWFDCVLTVHRYCNFVKALVVTI